MSYRTLDSETLLCEYELPMYSNDIYIISKKLYLFNTSKKKCFDLISKKSHIITNDKLTTLFDKYTTYNVIFKNLLFGQKFTLYHKGSKIINLKNLKKLKIYKNCIYYAKDHNIYRQIIGDSINKPIIILINRCHSMFYCCDY